LSRVFFKFIPIYRYFWNFCCQKSLLYDFFMVKLIKMRPDKHDCGFKFWFVEHYVRTNKRLLQRRSCHRRWLMRRANKAQTKWWSPHPSRFASHLLRWRRLEFLLTFRLYFSPTNRNFFASNFDLSGSLIWRKGKARTKWLPQTPCRDRRPRLSVTNALNL